MKTFRKLILIAIILTITFYSYSQQKVYDIVTYNAPAGWMEKPGEGNISYSKIDGKNWAQIAIYQYRNSEGDIETDFTKDWNEVVATGKSISGPEKTVPQFQNGWSIMSGSGLWQYNGSNVATMLTVYSNKEVCVAIMCNSTAKPYLKAYQALIDSLDIDAEKAKPVNVKKDPINSNTEKENPDNNSLVGIWAYNLLETSGYANGMPMYSAGYFRREYTFNADGTYQFLFKTWSVYMKQIMFGYETGTWAATNNQITIIPKQGKNEEWNKAASGRTSEWGSRIKSLNNKLEKVTYRYELKYYSGSNDHTLILYFDKPTEREATEQKQVSYSKRTEALIDLPPGTNIPITQSTSPNTSAALNAPLVGKIWEGTSLEKTGSGTMQMNTGGFETLQYLFYSNGTYRFCNVNASAFTNTKALKYETGTYTVNGNQLTIVPLKGMNEEWSIIGKTSNGNSDMSNRKIMETWNKKSKSSARKLEKYTYTFRLEYLVDNKANALILQRTKTTEREGSGNNDCYFFETSPANSLTLPASYK